MDEQAQRELFEKLGAIQEGVNSLKEDNSRQWEHMRTQDSRTNKLEVKNASLAGLIAVTVSVGVDTIKKTFTGGA